MKKIKLKIVEVEHLPNGFIGMNYWASKEHKFPFKYPQNTILILKNLPKSKRLTTINHEAEEIIQMKYKHHKYHKAHKIALDVEEYDPDIKKDYVVLKIY